MVASSGSTFRSRFLLTMRQGWPWRAIVQTVMTGEDRDRNSDFTHLKLLNFSKLMFFSLAILMLTYSLSLQASR